MSPKDDACAASTSAATGQSRAMTLTALSKEPTPPLPSVWTKQTAAIWTLQMSVYLRHAGYFKYVEKEQTGHADDYARSTIMGRLSQAMNQRYIRFKSAKAIWDDLQVKGTQYGDDELVAMRNELETLTISDVRTAEEYINRHELLVARLTQADVIISDKELYRILLRGVLSRKSDLGEILNLYAQGDLARLKSAILGTQTLCKGLSDPDEIVMANVAIIDNGKTSENGKKGTGSAQATPSIVGKLSATSMSDDRYANISQPATNELQSTVMVNVVFAGEEITLSEAHVRFGHVCERTCRAVAAMSDPPVRIGPGPLPKCVVCEQTGFTRHIQSRDPVPRPPRAGYHIAMDICGPLEESCIDGSRYLSVIVDLYSRRLDVRGIKEPTTAAVVYHSKCYALKERLIPGHDVKIVRTDNGPCYRDDFKRGCMSLDIVHEISTEYTSEQNDAIKRANRTIMEGVRGALCESGLSKSLAVLAAQFVVYSINRMPMDVLNDISPCEAHFNTRPKADNLVAFGQLCSVKNRNLPMKKFSDYGNLGRVVGYGTQRGEYYVLVSQTGSIVKVNDIVFPTATELAAVIAQESKQLASEDSSMPHLVDSVHCLRDRECKHPSGGDSTTPRRHTLVERVETTPTFTQGTTSEETVETESRPCVPSATKSRNMHHDSSNKDSVDSETDPDDIYSLESNSLNSSSVTTRNSTGLSFSERLVKTGTPVQLTQNIYVTQSPAIQNANDNDMPHIYVVHERVSETSLKSACQKAVECHTLDESIWLAKRMGNEYPDINSNKVKIISGLLPETVQIVDVRNQGSCLDSPGVIVNHDYKRTLIEPSQIKAKQAFLDAECTSKLERVETPVSVGQVLQPVDKSVPVDVKHNTVSWMKMRSPFAKTVHLFISWISCSLSCYHSGPFKAQFNTVYDIMHYMRTVGNSVFISALLFPDMIMHSDADLLNNTKPAHFTLGKCYCIGVALTDYDRKTQNSIAHSTLATEVSDTDRAATCVRKDLQLHIRNHALCTEQTTRSFRDNAGVVSIVGNHRNPVENRHNWTQQNMDLEAQTSNEIRIRYVRPNENGLDLLAKAQPNLMVTMDWKNMSVIVPRDVGGDMLGCGSCRDPRGNNASLTQQF